MNKTKRNKNMQQRSAASRKLLLQYIISVIAYLGALIVFIVIIWNICNRFTWRSDNPIYLVLKFVERYILAFGDGAFFIGWVIITYYFISKLLRYLDEVVTATEQLIVPSNEPIVLSTALSYAETELNRVREKALDNMRTVKEVEQRKNDLVIYLAHDLKTPLSSIIGYLTLIKDEPQISGELRARYVSISLEKAERLEDLINEFFEITRFNLSEITLQYSRINLTRLLEQLTFEFKPMLKDKNLSCELQAPADIMLRCDANKIQRVFDNLLRNAVLYSYPDTKIDITAGKQDTQIVIRFKNCGVTIPPEKLSRIFEQFYRLDAARSTSGGAGIGLAIAKQIVEQHGGVIEAVSADDTVEFTVTLPLS